MSLKQKFCKVFSIIMLLKTLLFLCYFFINTILSFAKFSSSELFFYKKRIKIQLKYDFQHLPYNLEHLTLTLSPNKYLSIYSIQISFESKIRRELFSRLYIINFLDEIGDLFRILLCK